jgi:hypothetical protein
MICTTPTTKICPTCATPKPLTEFFRSKASKDGFQNHCRTCQAIRKSNKPDESTSAAIRADQRCVDLINSATKISFRKYVLPDGKKVNLHKEIAKLGYMTSAANFSGILAGIRGELTPYQKRRQNAPNESEESQATTIAKPQKPVSNDTPELTIDIPGIYEVENRGKGYTSFRFDSPIDGSVFAFESFKEARKERQQMMSAFRQQAVFESVVRQKTGKKPADDEGDE